MAMPIPLGTLVTRARQRAEREGDSQLDPTEIKDLISEKYGEMHALIVEKDPTFFAIETAIDLTDLSLPANYLSTLGVSYVTDAATDRRRELEGPLSPQQRAELRGITGSVALLYALDATALALLPAVTTGTYKHHYIPQPTDYSSAPDATSVDVINVYGRQFILWGVAAIARAKGTEDWAFALQQEARALGQLEYWACQRALTHAPHRPIARTAQGPYTTGPLDRWWCPR